MTFLRHYPDFNLFASLRYTASMLQYKWTTLFCLGVNRYSTQADSVISKHGLESALEMFHSIELTGILDCAYFSLRNKLRS